MHQDKIICQPNWHDYLRLLPTPLIFSVSNVVLWSFIHEYIEIEYKESYMLESMFAFLLSLYLIHIASIHHKVEKEKMALERYWKHRNKKMFCETLDERIPRSSKWAQIVIVSGVLVLAYASPMSNYGGIVVIGLLTFFIEFLREFTEDNDNPIKGVYRVNGQKIKNEWPDVYESYFK